MKLLIFLFFITSALSLKAAEPVDSWAFDTANLSKIGKVLGKVSKADVGISISPSKDGKEGGILLGTDPAKTKLPTRAMTVEAWVRVDKNLEWGGIIGAVRDTGTQEAGWILGYRKDRFLFGLSTEGVKRITYQTSASPFVSEEWYYVVATYDGVDQQLLYVDGKLSAESTVQKGAILQPNPLFYTIGAYRDENDYYPFTGRLGGISVWHEALSSKEIQARFNKRKAEFPGIEPEAPTPNKNDRSWSTWMKDNQRSGSVSQDIKLHPSGKPEWIYEPLHPPAPAWPGTAKSDHWRKRSTPETPKSTFDWVSDVVSGNGRTYFASSSDDSIRCLDTKSGNLLWKFIAGGPVRLAPTLTDGKVVFGCDDGFVYCLKSEDGQLIWKSRPDSLPDRRLPGNGRIISVWPVRTGILAKGNTGYFGGGLFPNEGVWYCTIDLRNGKILDQQPVDFSPQGYIREDAGRLVVQTGRITSGGSLTVKAKGKQSSEAPANKPSKTVFEKFPHASVDTPSVTFVAGDSSVAAFERGGVAPVWEAEVDSPARGLAIADGMLFVSTMKGRIYAFSEKNGGTVHREQAKPLESIKRPSELSQLPRNRGYALVIGLGERDQIRALVEHTDLQIISIDTDSQRLSKARDYFSNAGCYGSRITLQHVPNFNSLPFVDGIFNLVIDRKSEIPDGELRRILRPWDGLAFLKNGKVLKSKIPENAGSWTHAYAEAGNSVSSGERADQGEMNLRWFGRPGPEHIVDRHLRSPPPLAAGGYLLVPGRDYLFGMDAHNGTVLWEQEIPLFMRASMLRDCGNLVLDPRSKRTFASSGASCLVLNVDTGETLRQFSVNRETEEWGYLAFDEELLIGSAVPKGAVRRELSYAAIWEGGYGDGKRAVCSHSIFAIDPSTGKRSWTYQLSGAVPNPSICVADGQVIFLESKNKTTLKPTEEQPGRWGYDDLIQVAGAELVALDLKTGKQSWRQAFQAKDGNILTFYLSCRENKLVAVNSRNATSESSSSKTLFYDVTTFAASNGKTIWEETLDTGRRPNLTHGEQDLHPVMVDGRLIVEPVVFDLENGKELFRFKRQGGSGCGTISASNNKLYFRAKHPAELDLETKEQEWVSKTTRPGCWINMIPANGLLLVPEGSSGCICGFPVQASMAFGPE